MLRRQTELPICFVPEILSGWRASNFIQPAILAVIFLLSSWLSIASVACAESSPELDALEAEEAYSRGLELREQGQMRNAFDEFNQALSLNPVTRKHTRRGRPSTTPLETRQKLSPTSTRALRLDPEIADAYYYRGLIFIAKGDSDSAVINLTRALQIDPEHTDAYFNRARVYFALQDIDAALGDLTSAAEIEDGSAQLYFLRGQVYLVAGETEKGLADIERTLELTDDDALAARAKELLSTVR